MIIYERMIQEIYPDKWAELELLDQKYNMVEARLGYPAKKRSRSISGKYNLNTLIIERQWESMTKMEAANELAQADPEYQALWMEGTSIIKSVHWELYMPMP